MKITPDPKQPARKDELSQKSDKETPINWTSHTGLTWILGSSKASSSKTKEFTAQQGGLKQSAETVKASNLSSNIALFGKETSEISSHTYTL